MDHDTLQLPFPYNSHQQILQNQNDIAYIPENYYRAISEFDTSRILTFVVSMTLVVYGSFRAIKIEASNSCNGKSDNSEEETSNNFSFQGLHTIESSQAMAFPLGASATLLIMFFFFDSLQLLFILMTALLATISFSFLLLPIFQSLKVPCFNNANRVSLGCCGRFTSAEVASLATSSLIVLLWLFTGHWLLMDALAMALCVAMIALVRLPSLKISVLLLFGFLLYDVFWVFLSKYIFSVNVMVKVATEPAYNPAHYITNRLHMSQSLQAPIKLSLPGKLVFPRRNGHFSMLGLGDVVIPGLFLCFVLRFDNHKKLSTNVQSSSSITYFHCSLVGYFVGLLTATVVSELSNAAQPALIYLVPFTILPIVISAYVQGDLAKMWTNPFSQLSTKEQNLEV